MRRLIVTALAMSALAACGSAPALDRDIAATATQACKTALDAKHAQGPFPFSSFNPTRPDPSKLPAIGRIEETTVRIYERWVSDLQRLGEPSSARKQWKEFVTALQQNLEIIRDQQVASSKSDTTTFTKDYQTGSKAQRRVIAGAHSLGLTTCADAAAA